MTGDFSKWLEKTGRGEFAPAPKLWSSCGLFGGRWVAKSGAVLANGMSELEEIFEVRGVRGLKLDHQSGREEESVKSEKQIPCSPTRRPRPVAGAPARLPEACGAQDDGLGWVCAFPTLAEPGWGAHFRADGAHLRADSEGHGHNLLTKETP